MNGIGTKKLVITDDNYKDTDKQDVTKAPFVMPWGTIIIILLLLIILILFFLLWKRRKDDEDDEEKND
ncbi:LPXTG cell wall anchor domain-containing protein [Holzapfeliella floricola]|uniref:LPXTG cell wall anchor domain-containing protein n=1 Tax=Holzapfeliella floricola TaxID=679249 RepID=UPI000B04DAB0|nr:LPXTG cell wall anchor domain-containing protein [Holzapfeliella floricola]